MKVSEHICAQGLLPCPELCLHSGAGSDPFPPVVIGAVPPCLQGWEAVGHPAPLSRAAKTQQCLHQPQVVLPLCTSVSANAAAILTAELSLHTGLCMTTVPPQTSAVGGENPDRASK